MPQNKANWNSRYEADDTPWDKGAPAPLLRALLREDAFPHDSPVLVPGCGRGYDTAALAEGGCHAIGLDIAALPIEWAKDNLEHPRADFIQGDLFDPGCLSAGSFGAIWEHTCYCAIQPSQRSEYVAAARRLLKPGGRLVGVFFTDTQVPMSAGPPFETSREEVVAMFAPYFTLVTERVPELFYPEREQRELLMIWEKKPST